MDRERLEDERDLQRKLIFEQLSNPQFHIRFGEDEDQEEAEDRNENVSIVEEDDEQDQAAQNQ